MPIVTDYRKMPMKAQKYPPAGHWFTDAVFGTEILRLTDERNGKRCNHAYSYWPALNCDSTKILIACDDVPMVSDFYVGVAWQPLCGDGDPPLQFEGATWSSTEPNVMKALGRDGILYRYNVAKPPGQRATSLADFSFMSPRQLTVSRGGTVYAFSSFFTDSAASAIKKAVATVWTASDNQRFFWKDGLPTDVVNEIHMCKGGTRAVVQLEPREGEKEGRAFLWAFRLGWSVELPNATGHWDNGMTIMVNGDGQQTGIQVRSYPAQVDKYGPANMLRYWRSDEKSVNWSIAEHVSLRADDESRMLFSTYGGDGKWDAFEKEIVFLDTHNYYFQRLAHTHSPKLTTTKRYLDEPHAVISQDGTWAIWTANLGNPKRWDVLAMRLP